MNVNINMNNKRQYKLENNICYKSVPRVPRLCRLCNPCCQSTKIDNNTDNNDNNNDKNNNNNENNNDKNNNKNNDDDNDNNNTSKNNNSNNNNNITWTIYKSVDPIVRFELAGNLIRIRYLRTQ